MTRSAAGFTLPEVLISLAIVVIAFLAMYGSAQQVVFSTTLQQEKTFATWVAHNQMTELRLATSLPDGDRVADNVEMAGLEWRYVIEFEDSPAGDTIKLANISVSLADKPDVVITQLQSAVPVTNPTGAGSGSGSSGAALLTSSESFGTNNGAPGGSDPNLIGAPGSRPDDQSREDVQR
ncbi:MAG: type II secretion system minor pseudopilin GspI [Gammaproteobacteria bacterium]|nr:type II secretion system minor pseudopilin GspI [Gammaproteobacteria bacterium]NND54385.1 type II secretion system minor pseudopilin GspI [Gammaproteobacteria bacterium]